MNKNNHKNRRYGLSYDEPNKEWSQALETFEGERFVEAFMVIQERDLLKLFLSDLFTEKELTQLTRRLAGVCWLSLGMPYARIQETTGLSPKIIARLNRSLTNKTGGFWRVMEEIDPHTWNSFEARERKD